MRDPKSPLRIADPDALGEVTLVPTLAPGETPPDAAEQDGAAKQNLEDLRAQFPQSPLALRVAALNTLMRR